MKKPLRPLARKMRVTQGERLAELPHVAVLPAEVRRDIRIVSHVLPFRVNDYVLKKLIDWDRVPDDPIYQMTFPQRGMLAAEDYQAIARLLDAGAPRDIVRATADGIRRTLNPHPGGQLDQNVPEIDGMQLPGLQHKYRETVLVFPAQGQTCHAYCSYCFRWAQFVGMEDLKLAHDDAGLLVAYLRRHRAVTDVLFTGGDPMVMSTKRLSQLIDPLLAPALEHIRSIRIGTKALAYWPYRFLTDRDADDFLRLVERCTRHGKHVSIMAHFTHVRELETSAVEAAVRRLKNAGAIIRTQAPLIRHVNDSPRAWRSMWNTQVRLGLIPYYMFVERDTGARRYFAVPLARAFEIFREAWGSLSGLARTVRGPSMSTTPGKVTIDGIGEIGGEQVFALRFLQARNPDWVGRPFFAHYDEHAEWLDELRPADGSDSFFFEQDPVQCWRDADENDLFSSIDAYGEDSFS